MLLTLLVEFTGPHNDLVCEVVTTRGRAMQASRDQPTPPAQLSNPARQVRYWASPLTFVRRLVGAPDFADKVLRSDGHGKVGRNTFTASSRWRFGSSAR